jgi:hypothetical protein
LSNPFTADIFPFPRAETRGKGKRKPKLPPLGFES